MSWGSTSKEITNTNLLKEVTSDFDTNIDTANMQASHTFEEDHHILLLFVVDPKILPAFGESQWQNPLYISQHCDCTSLSDGIPQG